MHASCYIHCQLPLMKINAKKKDDIQQKFRCPFIKDAIQSALISTKSETELF